MNDWSREGAPIVASVGPRERGRRLDGWLEAALFAVMLAVLNVSYGVGQQLGVVPVALLFWAMPTAALALIAVSGIGPDWQRIIGHPLSLVVGGGIIAMEAVYYVLLGLVTPTDGSVLVRLGVPLALVLGFFGGRRPTLVSALGGLVILGTVLGYVPHMRSAEPLAALGLGALCGLIMSGRSFASEMHPWNRAAQTIRDKMRVTGLMLILASVVGSLALGLAMGAAALGLYTPPAWVPTPGQLMAPEAIGVGLFVGVLVLTAMQYLGFSVVVKLGTERFIATTALIPLTTLVVQQAAVAVGLLGPIQVAWSLAPVMAGIVVGVVLVIAGGRRVPRA